MSQKKSVLVTGSARRIGRRLALDLAKDGWDVAVHCNASIEEAEEVVTTRSQRTGKQPRATQHHGGGERPCPTLPGSAPTRPT